ncbi:hypothetical protein crov096 [Cafeteria roenbergensis virus]|uniref:Uncharacterized protein n=1 Tax=Cafeteria roenbergensis virus (strain BV-PW1) TaxID=693272 RepID=E3T4L6_CROVB|nr:hypothetical protein crov096 [Cafeteria roenbergensis virus BV-PW1]ADO67129.1 hypothetical protein crov096 [Cafeteria roenbergensis virus BV-PW1]
MSYTHEQRFNQPTYSVKFPWLTHTNGEYTYERGYQFIEYQNFLNSSVNDKVGEFDYYNGMRYLKVKLSGKVTAAEYKEFDEIDEQSKIQRRLCRVLSSDILELDLNQNELAAGFRYLKIYLPFDSFSRGWFTASEKEDGWKISGKRPRATRDYSAQKRRKFRKQAKSNSMLEEVKKYISIS